MSCCGEREKGKVREYHKWDYITLSDFKSSGCGTTFSYIWLWMLAIIAVAVYGADTFTAVNLLAFGKWSSSVQPTIPFEISKWIFTGCILFSWALCIFEWIRAVQIMKRNSVADDYLDPMASTLQCLRGGQGYRKFLVFAALTKSKKGNDYVALFAYFQFKGMIRIILAQGPRQVINAITLWSVLQAQVLHNNTDTGIQKFWQNLEALADQNTQQAVILCSMLFTFVIWVFSALSLILAFVLYITFLWHFIPREDGTVSSYCRRKIEKRLENAVRKNYQKALEKEEAKRIKAEVNAMKFGKRPPAPDRKPTLPVVSDNDSDIFTMPGLSRSTTQTTLPAYATKPDLARMNTLASDRSAANLAEPKLPNIEEKDLSSTHTGELEPTLPVMEPALPSIAGLERPQIPSRSLTQMSNASKSSLASDTPLLAKASDMGSAETRLLDYAAEAPIPIQPQPSNSYGRPLPNGIPPRSASSRPVPGQGMQGPLDQPYGRRPPPTRALTSDSSSQQSNWNDPPLVMPGQPSVRMPDEPIRRQDTTQPAWPMPAPPAEESYEMQAQPRRLVQQAPPAAYPPQGYRTDASAPSSNRGPPQGPGPNGQIPGRAATQSPQSVRRFDPNLPITSTPPPMTPPPRSMTAPVAPASRDRYYEQQQQQQSGPRNASASSEARARAPVRQNTEGGWPRGQGGPQQAQQGMMAPQQRRPPPPRQYTRQDGYFPPAEPGPQGRDYSQGGYM